MTIVGVGHALVDAFALVGEEVPKALGLHPGSFNQVPDYRMRAILTALKTPKLVAGGSAANTVRLAARLGLDAHFVGQCGHDEAGQIFEGELLGAGVKVNLARRDAPTGICATLLSPGARTVATFRSASGDLTSSLVSDTILRAADVVVLEGYLLDEPLLFNELISRCTALRTPVALDTGEGSIAERHRDALRHHLSNGAIRHLFLQETEAVTLDGRDPQAALASLTGPGMTVVLKRADFGYLVHTGTAQVSLPPPDSEWMDPTGVGDAFQAGFFWALGQNRDPLTACHAGRLMAGFLGRQMGTRLDEASWAALTAALKTLPL